MQLEDYFDFLAPNDIRLKGHRIGVETLLYRYIHQAKTAEEIAAEFPTLDLAQVYATILYYLQNKETMDAYLTNWLDHSAAMMAKQEQNPTEVMLRLRKLKAERGEPQPE